MLTKQNSSALNCAKNIADATKNNVNVVRVGQASKD